MPSSSTSSANKKPSGGRPLVRRLLSKDSFSTNAVATKFDHGKSMSEGMGLAPVQERGYSDEKLSSVGPTGLSSRRQARPSALRFADHVTGGRSATDGGAIISAISNREEAIAGHMRPWTEQDRFVGSPSPAEDRFSPPTTLPGSGSGSSSAGSTPDIKGPYTHKPQSSSYFSLTTAGSGTSVNLANPDSPTEPLSPTSSTSSRWAQVRRHVLNGNTHIPSSPRSSTLPKSATRTGKTTHSPASSFTSFSQMGIPTTRPSTPKPSRFARLGFRHVVDHAMEEVVDSKSTGAALATARRKFAEDLQRACWAAQSQSFSNGKSTRGRDIGTNYLPFRSATSLPGTAQSSSSNLLSQTPAKPGHYTGILKSAPSVQSLVSTIAPTSARQATTNVAFPSFGSLHATLVRYAALNVSSSGAAGPSTSEAYEILPYEQLVLSVILSPFLNGAATEWSGLSEEDDRHMALEVFEQIIKSFKATSPETEMERALWCCKAASAGASPLSRRLLSILQGLLTASTDLVTTPAALRTLIPAIIGLLPVYSKSATDIQNLALIQRLIDNLFNGVYGSLDLEDLQSKYRVTATDQDSEDDVRRVIALEGIIKCLEMGSVETRRWVLHNALERYWPPHNSTLPFSPLQTKVHVILMNLFLRSAIQLLHPVNESFSNQVGAKSHTTDVITIWRLLNTRIFGELGAMDEKDVFVTKCFAVKVVIYSLTLSRASPVWVELVEIFSNWVEDQSLGWRECVLTELKNLVHNEDWPSIVETVSKLMDSLRDVALRNVCSWLIPEIHEHMLSNPPPFPYKPLSSLLISLAKLQPQLLYKPLFVCAASTQEVIVAHQLSILVALSRYLPDLWTGDAEMICVALLRDADSGAPKRSNGKERERNTSGPAYGKARLGQIVILLEVAFQVRSVRLGKRKDAPPTPEVSLDVFVRFLITMESRLAIILAAKEQTVRLPMSQRMLFAFLFQEIRLYTKSLKQAPWLPRVVTWLTDFYGKETSILLDGDIYEEDMGTIDKIRAVYIDCLEEFRFTNQRRSTTLLFHQRQGSLDRNFKADQATPTDASFMARQRFVEGLPKEATYVMFELLVLVSGLLTEEYLRCLGPILWDQCLVNVDLKYNAHVCFLVMQCAERIAPEFVTIVQDQMTSSSASVRREALLRLPILFSRRTQLLALTHLTDKIHRRPFKLARHPLAFVPTDIGTGNWVLEERPEDLKDYRGRTLPADLRRKLSEIGWTDDEKPLDPRIEWIQTPMSILPDAYCDNVDNDMTDPNSSFVMSNIGSSGPSAQGLKTPPTPPSNKLLRHNSSSGGQFHGVKHRSVIVLSLTPILLLLISLTTDQALEVSTLARQLLMDLIRNEPVAVCRPIMDLLSAGMVEFQRAITALQTLLHCYPVLPPSVTHYVFNHLAGFLRNTARDPSETTGLRSLADVTPVMTKLVSQVSDLSVRDIRRAKLDIFVFPSGLLYFPETAPEGSMFPRALQDDGNPPGGVPSQLVDLIMTRTSQNMFFLAMLKKRPQEAFVIRKGLTKFVLPGIYDDSESHSLHAIDYMPRQPLTGSPVQSSNRDFELLSVMLSKSYLLLIANIFRTMTRHLSDRDELLTFLNVINRILMKHGDDLSIVTHALTCYMIASTRFRRLMSSSNSFTSFMPPLLKVYAEAGEQLAIKNAVEYAVSRFYAIHSDSFLFQMMDVMSYYVGQSNADAEWIAEQAFKLLFSLTSPQSADQDLAGIHEANRAQEKECAMAFVLEERPQLFISLRGQPKSSQERSLDAIPSEILDVKTFRLSYVIRMLLTVIAHDLSIIRAQNFMKLLRLFSASLCNSPRSTRDLLREGFDALGVILMKANAKAKIPENMQIRPSTENSEEIFSAEKLSRRDLFDNRSLPSDIKAMRQDYLLSLVSYIHSKGRQLSDATISQALELAKTLLKDASRGDLDAVESFITEIVAYAITQGDLKSLVSTLKALAPFISSFGGSLNVSGFIEEVITASTNQIYANEPSFGSVVVGDICVSGLQLCQQAAMSNTLLSLPFRSRFVDLLCAAIDLPGADIMAEMERQPARPGFLVGVVLPFCLRLGTVAEFLQEAKWSESWRRNARARAWIRLLSYTMSVCQQHETEGTLERSLSMNSTERSKSRERSSFDPRAASRREISRVSIAVQILKVIIVRGEEELSTLMPGVWTRINSVLRSILSDGGFSFFFFAENSPLPSPMHSPYLGSHYAPPSPTHGHPSSRSASFIGPKQSSPRPRFVDYLLWSFLEFICLKKNPMTLQMRMFIQERVCALDERLKLRLQRSNSRRLSASVFSKRRSWTPLTPHGSPNVSSFAQSSPLLSPEPTKLTPLDIPGSGGTSAAARRSAFNRFPSPASPTPYSSAAGKGIKIVHLGPHYRPSEESDRSGLGHDDLDSARSVAKSVKELLRGSSVSKMSMVERTCQRIRVVQSCMGYSRLLPLLNSTEMEVASVEDVIGMDVDLRAWSAQEALRKVLAEVQELTNEFEDVLSAVDLRDKSDTVRMSMSSSDKWEEGASLEGSYDRLVDSLPPIGERTTSFGTTN